MPDHQSHAALAHGAVAGALATFPMTAVMEILFRLLPPTEQYPLPPSEITAKVTNELGVAPTLSQHEHVWLTLLLHVGYGAAVGGLYGAMVPAPSQGNLRTSISYGLAVWTASYLGLLPGLRLLRSATQHPLRRNSLMIAAHIVWGASLGQLLHSRTTT